MTMLLRIQKVRLGDDWLIRANHATAGADDYVGAVIAVRREFPDVSSDQISAIMFRMQAVALLPTDMVRGWQLPASGHVLVSAALLKAAAVADLDLTGAEPAFDLDQLKRLALEFSEEGGRG